jgi:gamma-glutamyltranspeptidase/glutathione hydrolase
LQLLGDPEKVNVPVARLLGEEYVHRLAAKIERTVKDRRPLPLQSDSRRQGGTVHLNSADRHGNTVALTLTHGNTFGACVTVEGLGLTLGHGMSRFDPRPNHPNSPGPGKRPLHNMCPTIVLGDGRPLLALGATGGRKIPNALFVVLAHYIGLGASASDAVAAPRLHTEGGLDLTLERAWPESEAELLKAIGYTVNSGSSAIVHAILFDPQTRAFRAASR